jgi:hypothetical protein
MMDFETPYMGRIAAYYNPAGSHADEAEAYLRQLADGKDEHGLVVEIFTTEPDHDGMVESLRQNVDEGDAVAVASGDGGTSRVLKGLLALGAENPTATLLGGNANDLAHMLHTAADLRKPGNIFLRGRQMPLRPLLVTATPPDGQPAEIYGFANWSAGASARAGQRYSDTEVRAHLHSLERGRFGSLARLIQEGRIAVNELRSAPPLTVTNNQGARRLVDINVSNGEREAKTIRFPLRILRDEAGVAEIKHPTVRSLVATLGNIACHRIARLGTDSRVEFMIETEGDVATQSDGEFVAFPSGTVFSVALADQTVNVYTTRRRYQKAA